MENKQFLNPVGAGKLLGVTRQQILKYISAGVLPTIQYKKGGRHHLKISDVIALRDGKNNTKNNR